MQNKLAVLFIVHFIFSTLLVAQSNLTFDLSCEIDRVYPKLALSKEQLDEARSLADLNRYFRADWVSAYLSVEISISQRGELRKALGENDQLNPAQKRLLNASDPGSDITVHIRYIPENTLKNKEPRSMDFSFTVEPENEAAFAGGSQQLAEYLEDNVIRKIPAASFRQYHLTAVKFTVDQEGKVINAHVFESSGDEKTDELLLNAVCGMPDWKPAQYAAGPKTSQQFVLTIGDRNSCVVKLLNIRND